jgi:glycosyltransferase involved in cell wall biosynthesis
MKHKEVHGMPHPSSGTSGRVVLSVCLPTFNRARYLECLLKDLAEHLPRLGFSYELLVGDNASEDDTQEVVNRYSNALNLRYFRRPTNIGGQANLNQLFESASGEYLVYVADDDFLLVDSLREHIQALEEAPHLGAVFAPWLIHDRITGEDTGQFYSLDRDVVIEQSGHGALLSLLISRHIFPEIYVIRASLARSIVVTESPFAFCFFVRVAAMVDRTAILFSRKPFYRSVSRYFVGEIRVQAGIEQVKSGWDCYRGGLEYICARFSDQLSRESRQLVRQGIDQFIDSRMQVGLRVRTAQGVDWIDNYYIAARLRSNAGQEVLPIPYDFYRANAAMDFLLRLQPCVPSATGYAYYADEPPRVLSMAHNFARAGFRVLADRGAPIPPHTVVLTDSGPAADPTATLCVSEAELLSRFP